MILTHRMTVTEPVRYTANHQDSAARMEPAFQQCRSCQFASQCLPGMLAPGQVQQFERGVQRCRSLGSGEHLYRAGDPVRSLYAVQSGALKSYMVDNDGREHVTSFHFCGEIMGIDAIYPARHPSSCMALSGSRVCVLPYVTLTSMAQKIPELQTQIFRLFSREVLGYSALAGAFSAEERLATFLVMVAARQTDSESTDLELPMARQDIANYLRLTPETLSRILARFQKIGLVKTDRKHITLLDVEGLGERAACMNPYARCGRRHDAP